MVIFYQIFNFNYCSIIYFIYNYLNYFLISFFIIFNYYFD